MITDYRKQSELIEVADFGLPIHVIGAGALGSWLAFFLMKMGFKDINVYDFDEIEEHNLPNQFYRESDIGKPKVSALNDICVDFFGEEDCLRLKPAIKKVNKSKAKELSGVVFCCVDSMKVRKYIYEECYKNGNTDIFIEGRIGLFGAYIYTLYDKPEDTDDDCNEEKLYEETLYDDEEAEVSACGISQTALPSAVNCASLMLMSMISWHRGNNVAWQLRYQIPDLMTFQEVIECLLVYAS